MSGLLFILKQHLPALALAEARALSRAEGIAHEAAIYFPRARAIPTSAGLTRRILRVHAFAATLEGLRVPRLSGSIRIRLTKFADGPSEREVADALYDALGNPRIDLRAPTHDLEVVIVRGRVYLGEVVWKDEDDWEARKAHRWPKPHPSAMHPTISRALVNLSGSSRVHDPFCGAGGFLIEAGLAGKRVSGADIKPEMVFRARTNCARYGVGADIRVADATQWLPRAAIVTDLPYGKSTRPVELQPLLDAFLALAAKKTDSVIIGSPSRLRVKPPWTVVARFEQYVHKSMTRHFAVLAKAL